MTVYGTSDGREVSFREWALFEGVCIPANAPDGLRVVETGYLGTDRDVEEYLKGLATGKYLERGEWPTWKHEGLVSEPFETTPHPAAHPAVHEYLARREEEF